MLYRVDNCRLIISLERMELGQASLQVKLLKSSTLGCVEEWSLHGSTFV